MDPLYALTLEDPGRQIEYLVPRFRVDVQRDCVNPNRATVAQESNYRNCVNKTTLPTKPDAIPNVLPPKTLELIMTRKSNAE